MINLEYWKEYTDLVEEMNRESEERYKRALERARENRDIMDKEYKSLPWYKKLFKLNYSSMQYNSDAWIARDQLSMDTIHPSIEKFLDWCVIFKENDKIK